MTYASPVDIREAVAPDGNVTGTCAELSDDQLQRAIQKAQDRVDASVGDIYPDDNVPSLLRGIVIALGSYYATLTYRKSVDLAAFDPIYLLYQDAIQTLTDVKNGVINPTPDTLPDQPPGQPYQRAKPKVINPNGDAMIFTQDNDFNLFPVPGTTAAGSGTTLQPGSGTSDWESA